MGLKDRALNVLQANPGKQYCMTCWGVAGGLTSPEDQIQLSAFSRTFVKYGEYMAHDGTCIVCGRNGRIVTKIN